MIVLTQGCEKYCEKTWSRISYIEIEQMVRKQTESKRTEKEGVADDKGKD
jgi:hypothetical protein